MQWFVEQEARTCRAPPRGVPEQKLAALLSSEWVHEKLADIPRQRDGFNCGVFAMVFAECLSVGFPLAACPLDRDTLRAARARIAHTLLKVNVLLVIV